MRTDSEQLSTLARGFSRLDRRNFVCLSARTLAAAYANASTSGATSLISVAGDTGKRLDAGVWNVAYIETGPTDGPAVMLLHGFHTTSIPMTLLRRSWPRRATES